LSKHDRIRIAVVTAYPPNRGRLSEYAKMLLTNLVKINPKLQIIVLADLQYSHSNSSIIVKGLWEPDVVFTLFKVIKEILKIKPHLVMFNIHFAVFGRKRISNFFGFSMIQLINLLKKVFRFKTITILHNIPEAIKIEVLGLKRSLINRIGFLIAEKMALSSDVTLVTLKLYVKMLKERFKKKKIMYLPHGAWSWSINDKLAFEKRNIIAFIGYLSPTKDLNLLINAFKKIREKNNVKLCIIGSPHPNFPESFSEIVNIKDDGIEVLGYVPDNKLPEIFKKTLAVVLPYKTTTGSSGVLHLVCSAGIPVIAVDHPEFRELSRDGAGILLTRNTVEDVAEKMRLIIKNKNLWYSLSRRSMIFGVKRSWDNVAKELNKIIVSLLKH